MKPASVAAAKRAVVMFTPLPPHPNGIGDYAFELLGPLSGFVRCTVVVEDSYTGARAPADVAVVQRHEYERRADDYAGHLHIYHIGNNPDHVYMLPVLAERPGLIVLHDPALHHLLDCATVARDDPVGYFAALETEYGVAGAILGEQFRSYWLREQRMYFDMPMLRGLLGPARGVIVHSRFAAAKVLTQVPEARVTVVPHQFSPPPPGTARSRDAMRAALGIATRETMFLSLGFVGRVKLVDAALRAIAAIRDQLPPFRYVIAGEVRADEFDVVAMIEALDLGDCVTLTGYVSETDFFAYLGAADVLINLRHPVGGETSGTMVRALGCGACVVLIDRGAFAEVPDDAAAKLPAFGPGFDLQLAHLLRLLAEDPPMRQRIGARARAFVEERNTLQATVAGYLAAIRHAETAPAPAWASRIVWEYLPPAELTRTVAAARAAAPETARLPLWFGAGAVPQSARPPNLLTLGDDWPEDGAADLLDQHLAAPSRPLTVDAFLHTPPPSRSIDLAVVCARAESLVAQDRTLLLAINLALAFGGLLVLNIVRRRATGTRLAIEDATTGEPLLRECGFRIEFSTATMPAWIDEGASAGPATEFEERCWRAVKICEFPCRPPRAVAALHHAAR